MQFSTSTILALVALVPSTLAHMYVSHPEVYLMDVDEKRSPLSADGSNYPCYETAGHSDNLPTYSAGSSQKFTIEGTAVHGGGSCQISITYDLPVTKDSQFHVVKSFHGDCPTQHAANLPANEHGVFDLHYNIPIDMPNGKAVVAWTWFNRVGIREMYMRCAPVIIDSQQDSDAALKALPTIWKAHIGSAGAPKTCDMEEPYQYRFLNPGSPDRYVESGTLRDLPETCRAFAGPTPTQPEKPKDEPKDEYKPEVPTSKPEVPTGKPSTPPVLIEKPKDQPDIANPPVAIPTKTNSPVATATVVPVKPDTGKPETPVKPAPSGGNCPEDGAIICTSVNTWAVCDHGLIVPMGRVANGMVCRQGSMEFANSKRQVRGMRFGHEHRRRHHKRAGNL